MLKGLPKNLIHLALVYVNLIKKKTDLIYFLSLEISQRVNPRGTHCIYLINIIPTSVYLYFNFLIRTKQN